MLFMEVDFNPNRKMNTQYINKSKKQINQIAKELKGDKYDINYYRILEYSKIILYQLPIKYKLISEEHIGEFYCDYVEKIPSFIEIYDKSKSNYTTFINTLIWKWTKYFSIRKKTYSTALFVKEQTYYYYKASSEDCFLESVDENQAFYIPKYYDTVSEDTPHYGKFTAYTAIENMANEQLNKDFNSIILSHNIITEPFNIGYMDRLYEKMGNKTIRKRILIFIMIFPDLIIDYYIAECSKLFSVNSELMLQLLSASRLLFIKASDHLNKERNKASKQMMRILELSAWKKIEKNYRKIEDLQEKIDRRKKSYKLALEEINRLNNKHISQRTLAKALNIKNGTISSSILYAKITLKECLELDNNGDYF